MDIKKVNEQFATTGQVMPHEMAEFAAAGYKVVICNRPDGEGDQPPFSDVAIAAEAAGMSAHYIPVVPGNFTEQAVVEFAEVIEQADGPVLAFCRSGMRAGTLYEMSQKLIKSRKTESTSTANASTSGSGTKAHEVLIVGAGAAGIAVAASLLKRAPALKIALVDPAEQHYYQPGWTMVGAGIFTAEETRRSTQSLIPKGVEWIKAAVTAFEPEQNCVVIDDGRKLYYQRLIVAPGLKLDWDAIPGLSETLGKNGVTSNYRFDLAPYTWQLVQSLKKGRAIFTQPPMPIKCAGAPQKALYLSADYWHKQGCLDDIEIDFCNAGAALFGVADYVPALMEYIKKYRAQLQFGHSLTRIDGAAQKAWFAAKDEQGNAVEIEKDFDMIHVVPPQCAPDFIRSSPLADAAGWVDVDQHTLRHKQFANIWSLGDVMNAPNAKTAAAARAQAPVVANNVVADIAGNGTLLNYNGYGSCPLTVERGKIVLAEFGYGGALLPTFPLWLLDGKRPTRLAWQLKQRILPPVYWNAMLRGRELLVTKEQAE